MGRGAWLKPGREAALKRAWGEWGMGVYPPAEAGGKEEPAESGLTIRGVAGA